MPYRARLTPAALRVRHGQKGPALRSGAAYHPALYAGHHLIIGNLVHDLALLHNNKPDLYPLQLLLRNMLMNIAK